MKTKEIIIGIILIIIASIAIIQATSIINKENINKNNKQLINITIKIEDQEKGTSLIYHNTIENNSRLIDLLEKIATIKYIQYPQGIFITCINNKCQNKDYSWIYLVNGKAPMVSVDNYILKEEAQIEFIYIKNSEAMKYFE